MCTDGQKPQPDCTRLTVKLTKLPEPVCQGARVRDMLAGDASGGYGVVGTGTGTVVGNGYWVQYRYGGYSTGLDCTVPDCTGLYRTGLYRTVPDCTVLDCNGLYRTGLYRTVLDCTVPYRTVLYRTVLYWSHTHCTGPIPTVLIPGLPTRPWATLNDRVVRVLWISLGSGI